MPGAGVRTTLYALLALEAAYSALWLARLAPSLAVRDWTALVLVAARAIVSSLELVAALFLRAARPAGPPLARLALASSALLLPLEIGWRLVPTSVDPTWRWWIVGGYWAYAAVALRLLRRPDDGR